MATRQYPYASLQYQTLQQIRSENKRLGGYFFERDTLRGWGNTVFPWVYTGYDGWFFVMSRQPNYEENEPVVYDVYKIFLDYRTWRRITLDNSLPTLKEARALAKELGRAERAHGGSDTYVLFPRGF